LRRLYAAGRSEIVQVIENLLAAPNIVEARIMPGVHIIGDTWHHRSEACQTQG